MSAKSFLDAMGDAVSGPRNVPWRDWFCRAFENLYDSVEEFDGKRPCGFSGWHRVMQDALRDHRTTFAEVMEELFGKAGQRENT